MRSLLPLLFLAVPLAAQDPKALPPPIVKMMTPKAPKAEAKALPAPERAIISTEVRYYIDSPVKLTVITSPPGYIEAIEKKGPLTVNSKFSDDPATFQEKEFKGPFVYAIKPKKTGPCEMLAMPENVAGEKDIHRQMIDVDDGTKPIPPPKPVDPVVPVEPVKVDTFRVIFSTESGSTLTPTETSILYGKQVEEYLKANCTKEDGVAGFRRYDRDRSAAKDQPIMAALWETVRPQITAEKALIIEVNGTAKILPFPKSVADALETLKKHNGGK